MTFFRRSKKQALVLLSFCLAAVTAIGVPFLASGPGYAQSAVQPLRIQAAQQSNHARLVFDLPANVNYSVTSSNNELRVTVDGRFVPDFSALVSSPVRRVGNGRWVESGLQTVIIFDALANIIPRNFRSGQYVILDVYGGDLNSRLPNAVVGSQTPVTGLPAPTTTTTPTQTAQSNNQTATPAATSATTSADSNGNDSTANAGQQRDTEQGRDQTGQNTDASNTSNDGGFEAPEPIQELPTEQPGDGAEEDSEPAVVLNERNFVDIDAKLKQTASSLVLSGISDAVTAPEKLVTSSVTDAESGIVMRFSLPSEAAAAVFVRSGSLWVLFDQPYSFTPEGLVGAGTLFTRYVSAVAQRPSLDALILQFKLQDKYSTVVERDQNDWLLHLKDTPAKPRFPLKPATNTQTAQGQQIFVSVNNIGRKVEFEDPDVGDILVALPLLKQGNGLAESYSYAAAQLLESAQGVIVIPETDFVTVERFPDGIAIRSTGNNLLAASQLPGESAEGVDADGFARLIDFESWRLGPSWEYRKNKARLFYELSLQVPEERNDVRWRIARYYLAHGRAAEALGMMDMMLLDDPLLVNNTDFLAVRGVANFKQGRLEAAKQDLTSRELEAEQDAELWMVMVSEAMGDHGEALEYYRRGRDIMGTYDEDDRAEIELSVIRAAIASGDIEQALRELDLLNGLELTEAQLSEQLFQRARIAEMQGQYDEALAQYDTLTDAPHRWLAARAKYANVKFSVKNGDLSDEDAIEELEQVRYAWRGNRFEAVLLDDLAGHYFRIGRYEAGLGALQLAISYYPDYAGEKRMLLRQQLVFKQLFLEGRADDMSPINAIGLFHKFRHLTPLGSEGDLLVRRLAQRMVSVDLLSNAAEVLDYQVRARTEGAARANIAADLAKIYIMNQRPDMALEILRATREPRLPQDIQTERRYVEARALVEQSRFEEAEVLLENERSSESDVIRADIFWGAQDWPRLITTVRRMLGDGWRRNEPMTSLQRMSLIRLTIAMTFAEDRAGLIEMRRRYGTQMRGGDFANAFDLLTNDQDLSGRELSAIASQIASVEKLQSFMRDYRNDFSGR